MEQNVCVVSQGLQALQLVCGDAAHRGGDTEQANAAVACCHGCLAESPDRNLPKHEGKRQPYILIFLQAPLRVCAFAWSTVCMIPGFRASRASSLHYM